MKMNYESIGKVKVKRGFTEHLRTCPRCKKLHKTFSKRHNAICKHCKKPSGNGFPAFMKKLDMNADKVKKVYAFKRVENLLSLNGMEVQ